jgi:hypothetical protein
MGTTLRKSLLVASLGLLACAAWAATYAVTSKPLVVQARHSSGSAVMFQLDVDCAQEIAGVNGEIRYNSSYFGQPAVSAGSGAPGFTALGSEIEPGKFRFVLYRSPTAAVDAAKPVLTFSLTTKTIPRNVSQTQVLYAFAAAAKPDGSSYLDSVSFSPVTIQFQAGASDWGLFR